MLQTNNYTSKLIKNYEPDTFTYKDTKVTIITVFTDSTNSTAIVEDENGEIFEVPRNELR